MKITIRHLAALTLGVALLTSCAGDQPTAAERTLASPATRSDGLWTQLAAQIPVNGLQRTVPIAAPITVSKSIGVQGGTLSIPEAGVTVTIPWGALTQTTTISMTARAGSLVAYDFAPHGTKFIVPITFSQDLRGTNVTPLLAALLQLGYYSDATRLSATTALIDELRSGVTNTFSWTFTSTIPHFSGYIVTSGRR